MSEESVREQLREIEDLANELKIFRNRVIDVIGHDDSVLEPIDHAISHLECWE